MKTIFLKLLIAFFSVTAPAVAFSSYNVSSDDSKILSAKEVANLYYSAGCPTGCDSNVSVEILKPEDMFKLPADLYNKLFDASFAQAQIWGDTILEGDYVAEGIIQLDEVILIKLNDKLVGFASTYSERGWFTADCKYVMNQPSSLSACEEGRIFETSFIALDFKDAEVDENQFADFRPRG